MAAAGNNTNMRMAYLATERGAQLEIVVPATPTYSLRKAYDGSLIGNAADSLATTRTALVGVDPTITAAT